MRPAPILTPPWIATQFFRIFLPRRDREMLVGDLAEEHALLASTLGPRQASGWYWRQVFRSAPPLVWANVRRGVWLKALGAIMLGYLAMALLVMSGDIVVGKLLHADDFTYSVISLGVGIPAMLLGGYLAAMIRPRAVIGLAVLSAVMGIVSLAATGDRAPLWYQIALIIVGPLASIGGGRIRARQKRGSYV